MVEDFVVKFAKLVVAHPDKVRISRTSDEFSSLVELIVYAHPSDVGKLIGKDGKMIASIKTLISGCKAKDGFSYRVVVRPDEVA